MKGCKLACIASMSRCGHASINICIYTKFVYCCHHCLHSCNVHVCTQWIRGNLTSALHSLYFVCNFFTQVNAHWCTMLYVCKVLKPAQTHILL